MKRVSIILLSVFAIAFAGKLYCSLGNFTEVKIPEFGVVVDSFVVPNSFAGYRITNLSVRVSALHDNPSDCEAWIEGPDGRCSQIFYRPDIPDWSLNFDVARDITWRFLSVSGTWKVYVADIVYDDGGELNSVEIDIVADGGCFKSNAEYNSFIQDAPYSLTSHSKVKKISK